MTAVAGVALTAAQWNASVRDNLLETAPAKATAAGRHFATSAANTIVERVSTQAIIDTNETTTSTTYTHLATIGPTVVVSVSAALWTSIYGSMQNSTANSAAAICIQLGGANTLAGADEYSISLRNVSSSRCAGTFLNTGLTAGSTTVRSLYRVDPNGTGTFYDRRIAALPL